MKNVLLFNENNIFLLSLDGGFNDMLSFSVGLIDDLMKYRIKL